MVTLKSINYNTQHYVFAIDSESDIESLPTQCTPGKGTLNPIKSCHMGSLAYCTDGKVYVLKGDTNEWVLYSTGSSGGGSSANITRIPDEKILALFDDNANDSEEEF